MIPASRAGESAPAADEKLPVSGCTNVKFASFSTWRLVVSPVLLQHQNTYARKRSLVMGPGRENRKGRGSEGLRKYVVPLRQDDVDTKNLEVYISRYSHDS